MSQETLALAELRFLDLACDQPEPRAGEIGRASDYALSPSLTAAERARHFELSLASGFPTSPSEDFVERTPTVGMIAKIIPS